MTLTFVNYDATNDGITLYFNNPTPGPNENNSYSIFLTNDDLAPINTPTKFVALVKSRISSQLIKSPITQFLDSKINTTITI